MSKVPSLDFEKVVHALRRDGGVVIRKKRSHIRLQKTTIEGVMKLTVPAHRPIKRSTLAHILKHAQLSVHRFLALM
jgi:predicted RNA binding protein YcfA (HicA-like mRNA interferase family)